jgi:hypothetical protein
MLPDRNSILYSEGERSRKYACKRVSSTATGTVGGVLASGFGSHGLVLLGPLYTPVDCILTLSMQLGDFRMMRHRDAKWLWLDVQLKGRGAV